MNGDNTATDLDSGAQSFYVTIYLVEPKHGLHGNVATTKQIRRSPRHVQISTAPAIHDVDFRKFRQCSKYFEAMCTRWTPSTQTPTEFYLEAHTETRFYKECFDRMHDVTCMIRPISSVTDCIELLKVASQIEFSHLLDVGVRYLASVPWSDSEELQIREFLDSGRLSSHSTDDLCQRLQVPEEWQQNYVKKVLRRSLKLSMTGSSKSEDANRRVFKTTFEAIVRGSTNSRPDSNNQATWQNIAVTVVKEEIESLWRSIKKELSQDQLGMIIRPQVALQLMRTLKQFAWLYNAIRWTYSGQEVVELILKDQEIASLLQWKFQSLSRGLCSDYQGQLRRAEKMWAEMVRTMFQDVLDGHLFLKASERCDLFWQWNWLLKAENFEVPDAIAALVCGFIMTFPQEEQEEIFDCWLTRFDGPPADLQRATCDLSKAYSLWLQHLVSKAVVDT